MTNNEMGVVRTILLLFTVSLLLLTEFLMFSQIGHRISVMVDDGKICFEVNT